MSEYVCPCVKTWGKSCVEVSGGASQCASCWSREPELREARIRADEREACAKLADGHRANPAYRTVGNDIAAAIRARGDK